MIGLSALWRVEACSQWKAVYHARARLYKENIQIFKFECNLAGKYLKNLNSPFLQRNLSNNFLNGIFHSQSTQSYEFVLLKKRAGPHNLENRI